MVDWFGAGSVRLAPDHLDWLCLFRALKERFPVVGPKMSWGVRPAGLIKPPGADSRWAPWWDSRVAGRWTPGPASTKYRLKKFVGVAICIAGLTLVVFSDVHASDRAASRIHPPELKPARSRVLPISLQPRLPRTASPDLVSPRRSRYCSPPSPPLIPPPPAMVGDVSSCSPLGWWRLLLLSPPLLGPATSSSYPFSKGSPFFSFERPVAASSLPPSAQISPLLPRLGRFYKKSV
ncbi:hypothetical protein KSP40_PGU011965 [Platanthera guangdongensis]|uniref:Uncharacterized protein n=1 Tax=Platanthera guangdongensis TaxID=2320717 RepID=A0ABR2LII0_9ASPA